MVEGTAEESSPPMQLGEEHLPVSHDPTEGEGWRKRERKLK